MTIELGSTFLGGEPEHLWFVISDTKHDEQLVLFVNMTSHSIYEDPACLLNPGDHPFVKHRSYINYAEARVSPKLHLIEAVEKGLLNPHRPASDELILRIQKGLLQSELALIEHQRLLESQGFGST